MADHGEFFFAVVDTGVFTDHAVFSLRSLYGCHIGIHLAELGRKHADGFVAVVPPSRGRDIFLLRQHALH